jgi:hypothetical protein
VMLTKYRWVCVILRFWDSPHLLSSCLRGCAYWILFVTFSRKTLQRERPLRNVSEAPRWRNVTGCPSFTSPKCYKYSYGPMQYCWHDARSSYIIPYSITTTSGLWSTVYGETLMSVAPHVLSTTCHYAKCILTACIIRMGVIKNIA